MEFTYEEVRFIISGLSIKLQDLVEDADLYCRQYEAACFEGDERKKAFLDRKSSEKLDKRDRCEALLNKFLDLKDNMAK